MELNYLQKNPKIIFQYLILLFIGLLFSIFPLNILYWFLLGKAYSRNKFSIISSLNTELYSLALSFLHILSSIIYGLRKFSKKINNYFQFQKTDSKVHPEI